MTSAAGVPGAPPSPDGVPASGAAPTKKDIKPSAIWYWVGAGLLVVSLIGGFTMVVVGIASVVDAPADHQRISVPGERTLQLPAAGTYEIYGETSDYGYYSTTLEPPRVEVKDSAGASVPVSTRPVTSRSSYYYQGYEAFEFATVAVSSPGAYTFTVRDAVVTDDPLPVPTTTSTTTAGRPTTSRRPTTTSPFSSAVPADRVAVGQDLGGRTGALIGGGFALMGFGSIAGIVVLIVVGVRRSGSRKRLFPPPARPAFAGYPGPGGYGPYGAPGYGVPGYGAPGYGAPGYGAPGYGAGGYGAPGFGGPATPGRPAPYGPYGAPPAAGPAGPWTAPGSPSAPGGQGAGAPSGPPSGPPVGPPGAPPPPFGAGLTGTSPPPFGAPGAPRPFGAGPPPPFAPSGGAPGAPRPFADGPPAPYAPQGAAPAFGPAPSPAGQPDPVQDAGPSPSGPSPSGPFVSGPFASTDAGDVPSGVRPLEVPPRPTGLEPPSNRPAADDAGDPP